MAGAAQSIKAAMADLLFLILLPLVLLFFLLHHASPIKALLTRVRSVLVPELSTVWKPQPASIFVTDHETAHSLLVRGSAGGSFSNRPPSISPSAILSRRRYQNITSAPYGQHWRAIRHNLSSELLHPARLHRYASARRGALRGLVVDLAEQRKNGVVHAAESIRYAMFGLVANMCFGGGIDNSHVRAMADAQSDLVKSLATARVFAHAKLPAVTRFIYRNRWKKLAALRQQQEETYLPLIDSRRGRHRRPGEPPVYVDTLIDLLVPDDQTHDPTGQRRLSDGELVGMCSEFLGAGTETTASALQWIMANLVKRPYIQEAVRREIDAIVGEDAEEVSEDVLGKLEYLNAVIMEALRLHPPTSFAFRQVMEEDHVVHNGQRIPVGTKLYFPLATIARDMTAWANPDEFKPQRFLACKGVSEGTDGTIKMMPFGGGRRMCPGRGVAMLHLSYFTANLMREFRWREGEGELVVDLEPHVEFFTVMKRPLRAHLELGRTDIKMIVN